MNVCTIILSQRKILLPNDELLQKSCNVYFAFFGTSLHETGISSGKSGILACKCGIMIFVEGNIIKIV